MKTEEDEAFEDIERRQGGFKAKQAMAEDKVRDCIHGSLARSCQICDLEAEVEELAGIKAILDEYGLQAIDFVADFKAALAQPAQPVQNHVWRISNKVAAFYFWSEDAARKSAATSGATWWNVTLVSLVDVAQSAQRPWVGLTDEEVDSVFQMSTYETEPVRRFNPERFAHAIEQALKDKNT
jgi:hypothetical protein